MRLMIVLSGLLLGIREIVKRIESHSLQLRIRIIESLIESGLVPDSTSLRETIEFLRDLEEKDEG